MVALVFVGAGLSRPRSCHAHVDDRCGASRMAPRVVHHLVPRRGGSRLMLQAGSAVLPSVADQNHLPIRPDSPSQENNSSKRHWIENRPSRHGLAMHLCCLTGFLEIGKIESKKMRNKRTPSAVYTHPL
jgi:hypothetical protein